MVNGPITFWFKICTFEQLYLFVPFLYECCGTYQTIMSVVSFFLHNYMQQFRKLRAFPFSVFFIVGNEFCERFSYYGMRGKLQVYCRHSTHIIHHTPAPSHDGCVLCDRHDKAPVYLQLDTWYDLSLSFSLSLSLPTAVLVLFLHDQLLFNENSSTAIYHAFAMLCYLLPLLGAIISDSCLGKYW